MSRSPDVVVDVAILGGGIAGLWLLDRLRAAGYSAIVLERDRLGAGQSVASQGIIHGGTKYTLGLVMDSAVRELREMPSTWRRALEAAGGPDLSAARTLSPKTYMWVPRQLGGGLLRSFSQLIMRSRVKTLPRESWPAGLRSPDAAGSVHAVDELVLDVPSVLAAIQATHRDWIRWLPDGAAPAFSGEGAVLRAGDLTIGAKRFVLTAGGGNRDLLALAGIESVRAQHRPLHQVLIAGMKDPLYAHCVGKSTKPLATITAHPAPEGDYVWYVGGGIAEDGVGESPAALIERARRELPRLFPGADFAGGRWATLAIDRAEGAAAGGRRPSGPVVLPSGPFIVAWPTKLALAPATAERVLALLREQGVSPGDPAETDALASLAEPEVARPPWEGDVRWS